MSCAVELKNITKEFSTKKVLNGINLTVGKGEILGLLGPSGAGKTTIVKILTGQLEPTSGNAYLLGSDTRISAPDTYRKVGAMMDNYGLYERFSVYENMKFYADIYRVSKEKINSVLKDVGLYEARKTPAAKLSKGMRSRLSLARAVLNDAEVLFLDEPTSGLDPATTREIHSMLAELKSRGVTIFLTTHNMTEAESICDNVALLNQGNIVEYGAPDEICRKYNRLNKIRIGLKDGTACELENSRVSAEKVKEYLEVDMVETIHSSEPNLETVFIELTGRGFCDE